MPRVSNTYQPCLPGRDACTGAWILQGSIPRILSSSCLARKLPRCAWVLLLICLIGCVDSTQWMMQGWAYLCNEIQRRYTTNVEVQKAMCSLSMCSGFYDGPISMPTIRPFFFLFSRFLFLEKFPISDADEKLLLWL